jgi:hypothetical protein
MELLELSIKYIDIATQFQSLSPHLQSEFLEIIQDEYPYTETPPAYGDIETLDDYHYYVIYGIIHIFYEEYENPELSSLLENYIHIQYEFNPKSLEMLLHLATSLSAELQSLV